MGEQMSEFEKLGFDVSMNREELKKNIYGKQQKVSIRLNTAEGDKRYEYEKSNEAFLAMATDIEKVNEDRGIDILIIKTYLFAIEVKIMNDHYREIVGQAIDGNVQELAGLLKEKGNRDLHVWWMKTVNPNYTAGNSGGQTQSNISPEAAEIINKANTVINGFDEKIEKLEEQKKKVADVIKKHKKLLIAGIIVLFILFSIVINIFQAIIGHSSNNNVETTNTEEVIETEEEVVVLGSDTAATSVDSFEYSDKGDYISITKYVGDDSEVIVPSYIDGKPVMVIDNGAFQDNINVTSITLKSGIVEIGSSAFSSAKALVSIELPDTLVIIGQSAFASCSNLESIEIPSSVTYIGSSAFENAQRLSEVIINEGYEEATIDSYAFKNCAMLTKIIVPGNYITIGTSAFNGCNALESFQLEEATTGLVSQIIEDYAFQECSSLQAVELPSTLIEIERGAFLDCNMLVEIELKEGLTYIADNAFKNCASITTITIPSTVTYIGASAFSGHKSLTEIIFTEGSLEATIDDQAFYDCASVTSIVIPGNYLTIGSKAFASCVSLTSFVWEASDALYPNQEIEDSAFDSDSALKEISLPTTLLTIDKLAFNSCTALVEVEIPEGVTSIGSKAFTGCSALTSVYIPSTITTIGDSAFASDSSLSSVVFTEGELDATIGNYAFRYCSSLTSIVLPSNYTSIGDYAFDSCEKLYKLTWVASEAAYANQEISAYAFASVASGFQLHISENMNYFTNNIFNGTEDAVIYAPLGSISEELATEYGFTFIAE